MKYLFNFFASGAIIVLFVLPLLVQAEEGVRPPNEEGGRPAVGPINIVNPFKCPTGSANCTIKDLINVIVDSILLPIGGVVAVVMIIYAGFLYVTAGGDPGQIKKAHDALLWAVIGAAILLGAWVISQAISGTIDTLRKP